MDVAEVLDRIVALLDATTDETVNTSMRVPVALRDAAALAVEHLDVAPSTTSLTTDALRKALELVVFDTALALHEATYPQSRPTLAEVALALAEQDGSPLAQRPDLIARAAGEVLARHPDADADDVLLWVEAQLAATS